MSKCHKCGVVLEPNTLKCKCGAIIHNEVNNIGKDTFIEKLMEKDLMKVLVVVLAFIIISTGGAILLVEIMEYANKLIQ